MNRFFTFLLFQGVYKFFKQFYFVRNVIDPNYAEIT